MKKKQTNFEKEKQELRIIRIKQLIGFIISTLFSFIIISSILTILILSFKQLFKL